MWNPYMISHFTKSISWKVALSAVTIRAVLPSLRSEREPGQSLKMSRWNEVIITLCPGKPKHLTLRCSIYPFSFWDSELFVWVRDHAEIEFAQDQLLRRWWWKLFPTFPTFSKLGNFHYFHELIQLRPWRNFAGKVERRELSFRQKRSRHYFFGSGVPRKLQR